MTVYVPSVQNSEPETVVRPYARQERNLSYISPVHILQHGNTTTPPACQYNHNISAVIFSAGGMGNVFHEMNEIIIPLYITTKQFQSRVQFIVGDYKPSFVKKYGKILSHLSENEVINPATNGTVHCFPGSIVGLKYHDNLALNASEIPGGYSMSEFKHFLWQVYSLKFTHVSQIQKPRLMLLSRTGSRRFVNEDDMISLMKELGFEVLVVRRSKMISDLDRFAHIVNSCSVLVGAHGAGLTNEIFLPDGAVMIQVELLGMEWASRKYYGGPARAMGVNYLRYKMESEESSSFKLYGLDQLVVRDPVAFYKREGYDAGRNVYINHQNARVNLTRFRDTLVEAFSIVTYLDK